MSNTTEVVSAAVLGVLRGVKELSDALPPPAGPIVKGTVQTALYIMELTQVGANHCSSLRGCSDCGSHQKYEQSKEDVYRLALRAAEATAIVVNGCDPRSSNINPELQNNLNRLKKCVRYASQVVNSDDFARVLEDIHSWVGCQTKSLSKGQKVIRFFTPDDMCARLNKKLDDAIALFGVCTFLDRRTFTLALMSYLRLTAEEPDFDATGFE